MVTSFGFKLDEQVGLKLIVNTIQQADIAPLKRLMLTGLINKSLYIGQPAHEYQTVTKKVLLTDSAKLTPAYCIYHSYTNPHDPPTEATYEHLLWNSAQAQYISGTSPKKLYLKLDLRLIDCLPTKFLLSSYLMLKKLPPSSHLRLNI